MNAELPSRGADQGQKKMTWCSAVRVLRSLRDQFKETVVRQEINMKLLGASLAAMRKDAGVLEVEMAAHLEVDTDDLGMFESGDAGLNLWQQVEYIRKLGLDLEGGAK